MTRFDQASRLRRSRRGNYLIGKALYYAIKSLENQKNKPTSDINDMKLLMEQIYPIYNIVATTIDDMKDKVTKRKERK